jgi:hypothetical protein
VPALRRLAVVALALASAAAVLAGAADPPAIGAGIRQLVEARPQGRRCTGAVVELSRLVFKPTIDAAEIELRDDKHDADLRSVMQWEVSTDGKRLTVRFKTPSTDFGVGNALRVCVDRAAFRPGSQPANDRECWMIGTDLL